MSVSGIRTCAVGVENSIRSAVVSAAPRELLIGGPRIKIVRRLWISVGEIYYAYLIRVIRRMHPDFSKLEMKETILIRR